MSLYTQLKNLDFASFYQYMSELVIRAAAAAVADGSMQVSGCMLSRRLLQCQRQSLFQRAVDRQWTVTVHKVWGLHTRRQCGQRSLVLTTSSLRSLHRMAVRLNTLVLSV